jgi:hypothetical protein
LLPNNNELVPCIEILSSVKTCSPRLSARRQCRQRLYAGGEHLLELDLLRRSTRTVSHPRPPASAYLTLLTHSRMSRTNTWPIGLRDALPILPAPRYEPDPNVVLDLALGIAYYL